jgi:amino acid transporter
VDRVISTLASIMLSGLVLATAWVFSGGLDWMEGRQRPILEVIAMLGGPLGFWGGVALLVGVVLATYGVHQTLNYYTALIIIKVMIKTGQPRESILRRIEKFHLSAPMKERLLAAIRPKETPNS